MKQSKITLPQWTFVLVGLSKEKEPISLRRLMHNIHFPHHGIATHIYPLIERGYVESERRGRGLYVKSTTLGKKVAKALAKVHDMMN